MIVKNKNYLLDTVLLLVLIVVTRIQELFSFLLPFRLTLTVGTLALLVYLFSKKRSSGLSLLRITSVKLIITIYLLCFISVPFSIYTRQSVEFVFLRFSVIIVFIFLLMYSVNNYIELKKVVWVYILGVLIFAISAITEGSKVVASDRVAAGYSFDPNDSAAIFVVTLPLIYFLSKQVRGIYKIFLYCVFSVLIFGLVGTASRGGFLGLFVIILLILFKDASHSFMLKITAVVIFGCTLIHFAPDAYWDRMSSISSEQDYNRTADGGRVKLWKKGMQLMLQNPVVGVGAGAIETAMGVSGARWMTAHNSFVQIGAELGVGGMVSFIALLWASISGMRRSQLQSSHAKGVSGEYIWLATAIEVSLWGACVTGFFLSWAYSPVFLFVIALSGIMQKIELSTSDLERNALKAPSTLRRD